MRRQRIWRRIPEEHLAPSWAGRHSRGCAAVADAPSAPVERWLELCLVIPSAPPFAAHWTYSDVPYSSWLGGLGIDLQDTLGSSRNMFDRLVHLAFGLLVVRPIVELESNYAGVNRRLAYRLAILFVLASSAAYEIFEWTLAILISPEAAEAYNGQQGDVFDAQKDMWMATAGAILGLLFLNRRYRRWRQN